MLLQVLSFHSDQKRFIISQIITSIYNSIISGVLMTGLLLYLGISTAKVGIILSIPLLANILQIQLAGLWSRYITSKKNIIRMILLARLLILSIVFVPIIVPADSIRINGAQISIRGIVVSGVLLLAYVIATDSGIRQNYWMVNTINSDIKGTFFAFRDKVVSGMTIVISLTLSYIIDILKKSSKEFLGFVIAFTIAAVLALVDYLVMKRAEDLDYTTDRSDLSIRKVMTVIKGDRGFLLLLPYLFILSFSLNIANPYYNVYMLNKLHLTYTKIMLLTVIQVIVQILAASLWSKIVNRVNLKSILSGVTLILGIQFIVWSFVRPESIGLIVVIFITSGMIATGLSTSQFMLPFEYIKPDYALSYLSLTSAISAVGGFLGSVTGANIILGLDKIRIKILFLEFGAMQINMVVSGIMILLTVCYMIFVIKKR